MPRAKTKTKRKPIDFDTLSDEPCPRCLDLGRQGSIRVETVQRLPLQRRRTSYRARRSQGQCCYDCASADALMRVCGGMDFSMASDRRRKTTGRTNIDCLALRSARCRWESHGHPRRATLESQYRWLEKNSWFEA